MSEFRKNKKQAKALLSDARLTMRRARKQADQPTLDETAALVVKVMKSMAEKDAAKLAAANRELETQLQEKLGPYLPNPTWEFIKAIAIAVTIALFIRWMFVETFRIPSGSMIPTLLVGDQLVVNKLAFGPNIWVPKLDPDLSDQGVKELLEEGSARYRFDLFGHDVIILAKKLWHRGPPARGDVVIFLYPRDPRKPGDTRATYIKRVIGLPGDTIEIREGDLYINGEQQETELSGKYEIPPPGRSRVSFNLFNETVDSEPEPKKHLVIHTDPPDRSRPNYSYGPIIVPDNHLLMMGDNRDQSYDSRSWGFVPLSHLKGRAMFIHLPLNPDNHYLPRWERFFMPIR